MLQLLDWKELTLIHPKNATIFGLERVNPFHPKNAAISWT
jgi:hypothetical protein